MINASVYILPRQTTQYRHASIPLCPLFSQPLETSINESLNLSVHDAINSSVSQSSFKPKIH